MSPIIRFGRYICVLALLGGLQAWAASVSISSPSNDQSVSSPFRVVAKGSASGGVRVMQVYVDGSKVYEVLSSSLDANISATKGTRRVTVQAIDYNGAVGKSTIYVNVTSTSTSTSGSSSGVNISSPGVGQTVSSPVRVVASGPSSTRVLQIYLDGKKVYETYNTSLDTSISASSGSHRLTVQSLDSSNNATKSSVSFSVGSTSSSSTSTSKKVVSRIEEMSGWESCDVCAGKDANGPRTYHTMTQNVSSPSLDGKSARFYIKSDDPYGHALWWRHLGGDDKASNFVYETYFYMKTPTLSQALEFDVNQSHSGKKVKYIFGTECDYRGTKQWKVWDNAGHTWRTTGLACSVPEAYKWHHLVLEFKRTSSGVQYISVTLNGKKSYFNKSYSERPKSASNAHINVAFQMDGNGRTDPYEVWLDKLSLTYW